MMVKIPGEDLAAGSWQLATEISGSDMITEDQQLFWQDPLIHRKKKFMPT